MNFLCAALPPATGAVSGWDKVGAVGSFVGGFGAIVAALVALHIGRRDREAASQSVTETLADQGKARRREHEIDLLLGLLNHVSDYHAARGHDGQGERRAAFQAKATLVALADASPLVVTRSQFAPDEVAFAGMPTVEQVHPELGPDTGARQSAMNREIGDQIKRLW